MIKMKFSSILMVPLRALTLILTSCTRDVFVPDTRPSTMHVILDGDGDSTVIAYNPEGLEHVGLQHLFSFPIKVYDKAGQLVTGDIEPAQLGRVVLKSSSIDMEFQSTPAGIKVKVNECMSLVTMYLNLDYGYAYYSVEVEVKQCSPYDIQDVKYDMKAMEVFGPWAEDASSTFVVNNNTDNEIRLTQYPFKDEFSEYQFDMEAPVRILTSIDENPMDVEIPTFTDEKAGLYGRKVSLGSSLSVGNRIAFTPTVSQELTRTLVAPPHTHRRYYRYVQHMELSVPVRIVARNPVNGNMRDFTGTLYVKEPTGFFYGYLNITDNE